jgi:hypothetical protein
MGFMDKFKDAAGQAAEAAKGAGQVMSAGMSSETAATAQKMNKLATAGVEHKALLRSMTPTGKQDALSGGAEHTFDVEVRPEGGSPYECSFNQDLIPQSVQGFEPLVGQEITVKVDPDDPQSMVAWG